MSSLTKTGDDKIQVRGSLDMFLSVHETMFILTEQVRNVPKAYRLTGTTEEGIVGLSKAGISALKYDKDPGRVEELMTQKSRELRMLKLPAGQKEEFTVTAMQEVVEYYGVKEAMSVLFGEEIILIPQIPDEIIDMVTPQTLLAGVVGVPGELLKILRYRLTTSLFTPRQKYVMWNKLHAITQQIYETLEKFVDVPGRILHAGHRYDYRYNFRFGALPRVQNIVERCEEQVLRWQEYLEKKEE